VKISTVRNVLENIYNAMAKLPKPIRRVCLVQVFAFMGWCVIRSLQICFRSFHVHQVPIFVLFVRFFPTMNCQQFLLLSNSTTYVGQIMAYEHNAEPDHDVATRTGEFAMLIFSVGMLLISDLSCFIFTQAF